MVVENISRDHSLRAACSQIHDRFERLVGAKIRYIKK